MLDKTLRSETKQEDYQDPVWGQQLRRISIFAGLNDGELSSLYKLGEIRQLAAQAHAVIEGELSRGLFILLRGTVSVYKTDPVNKNMLRLAFLEAGAVFGELSLFDQAPRSATVVAESPCDLFYLDIGPFRDFLDRNGDNLKSRFYKKCAEDMAERFRRQNGDYVTAQKLLWQFALRRSDEAEPKKSSS